MKPLVILMIVALPAEAVSPRVATAAAVTTIAVNAVTIDKTARATWKGMRAAKRVTNKVAKKVVGK